MPPKKSPYEFFSVSSDIMVLRVVKGHPEVLLIQRKYPPHQGSWALPGGFVDRHEDTYTAAVRELYEETGLRTSKLYEFGSFSAPHRDPRGRTLTIAYYAKYSKRCGEVKAGDDAGEARWFSVQRLPSLAFDHKEMIALGLKAYRKSRRK